MRFHGLVLAGISGIPFIGMGKDHKLADLCSRYDFPYIPLDELSTEKLISAADALKEKIPDSQVTQALQLAARENFRFFQE
jgi:polysaccharide pyruvyl transferase WcaK-like protein